MKKRLKEKHTIRVMTFKVMFNVEIKQDKNTINFLLN